ncbi:MAG: pyrroloquinoline quinone-dependent dehydrogenase [Blastocatellia bacterium]|nr:MAG: pyrroloquinoline quinone-dependent dehydrogenase [Blastocatellia bacterium]
MTVSFRAASPPRSDSVDRALRRSLVRTSGSLLDSAHTRRVTRPRVLNCRSTERLMTWRIHVAAWLLAVTTCALGANVQAQNGEWRDYAGDAANRKYTPLDQINKENVTRLRIAWRRPAVDPQLREVDPQLQVPNNFRVTPLMVGGVLYTPNGVGLVEAFHPGTGKTVWVQEAPVGPQGLRGDSTRGLAYWRGPDDERVFVQRGETLMALNLKTGRPYADFGRGGTVNLRIGSEPYRWSGAPHVCRDVVIVGSSMSDSPARKTGIPGDVRAFDVRTGTLRWTFHVIPREGEFGLNTWKDNSWQYTGHANLWSLISSDEELGFAYLPLTSPTSDMYGGHRPGDNLFSDALVAVNCRTGQRVWHYQLVHHDLWDYDLPAAPVLADIRVDGRDIKSVVQVTKQGFAFVFDRATGRPVWPIEERAVPQSNTPGEQTSPTQPFPTKPPPFERQGVTVDDLIDFTPELRAAALDIVKRYVIGPVFTPPSIKGSGPNDTKGTIQLPGSVGGADWQGAAFDPETGILYVESITGPFVADIIAGDPKTTDLAWVRGTREYPPAPMGLPLLKPPYGRITAIDLNKGERLWMVPNGDGPRDHPLLKPLNLPPLGNPGRSAPLVTKTLLFVGEGDSIMADPGRVPQGMPLSLAPGAGGRKFRAYDKATGKVLWETELPAGTTGAPMSYMFEGKQYVVVAVGARDHPAELVALSLP